MKNIKKILVIERCDDCPHFDNEYYDYVETCQLLDRKIKSITNYSSDHPIPDVHPIPKDCPLEDSK